MYRKRRYKNEKTVKRRRRSNNLRNTTKRTRSNQNLFGLPSMPDLPEWASKPLFVVLFFALGVFFLLALSGEFHGPSVVIGEVLFKFFGVTAWILPLLFFILTFYRAFSHDHRYVPAKIFGFFLSFGSLAGLIHLSAEIENGIALEYAENGIGGGYLGFTVSTPLRLIFENDFVASVILFFGLMIGLIYLGVTKYIDELLEYIKSKNPVMVDAIPRENNGRNKEITIVQEIDSKRTLPEVIKNIKDDEKELIIKSPFLDREEIVDVEIKKDNFSTKNIAEEKKLKENQDTVEDEFYWEQPDIRLLNENKITKKINKADLKQEALRIQEKLSIHGINVDLVDAQVGPTVIRYTMRPSDEVKLNKITGLKQDLMMALAARSLRIEAPIPGTSLVGLEIPNRDRMNVLLRDILESKDYKNFNGKLKMAVGHDVTGKSVIVDLAEMPHMIIAGQTGSGKSVAINDFIVSMLYEYSPKYLRFVMIDPKAVELTVFNGIPHLLTPTIDSPDQAITALKWLVSEMERRLIMQKDKRVRNISEYNENLEEGEEPMFYIVVIIDELADLMMTAGKEVEGLICRIAQKARSVGIHLILGTQSPRVSVVTGLIKANIPTRMACTVATQMDSRVILDANGAEALLGRGDMLYASKDGGMMRIQCAFVSTEEVNSVVNHIKLTCSRMEKINIEEAIENSTKSALSVDLENNTVVGSDPLTSDAWELIKSEGRASATTLQRRLGVGYARAARILDELETLGKVGPANGAKPREIFG